MKGDVFYTDDSGFFIKQGEYNILKKKEQVLEILKAFDFEVEDYTEELNGSVCVKQRRIILDPEEIDLIKEWLNEQ